MTSLPLVHISILDDHRLFRQGIMYILQNLSFETRVQEAATFRELQAQFAHQVPDVLLPDLHIIVISMHSTDDFIAHMFKLGVRSYLPKDVDKQLLSTAIAAVMTEGY